MSDSTFLPDGSIDCPVTEPGALSGLIAAQHENSKGDDREIYTSDQHFQVVAAEDH